jgi:PKD repeat protein
VDDGEDSTSETTSITINNLDPWNVDAGEDQDSAIGEEVQFSGSAEDVEADTLNYTWDFGDESPVESGIGLTNPTHVYTERRDYTVTLTVSDEDGGSATDTLTVSVYNYQIELSEGWNLFSIPLVPENDDTSINVVLGEVSSDAYVIWAYVYDEETGKNVWKYNTPDSDGWNVDRTLQNIIPGYGYYIKMNNEVLIYNNGEKMYGNSDNENEWNIPKPPVVTLTPSWNLVGHYGMNTDVSKEEALDTLGESYSTMLDMEGNPISDGTNLSPTQGYWLFVTGTDNLDYAPSEEAYSETV